MAGLAVSVLSIWLLARSVDLGEVGASLRGAERGWIAAAVLSLFTSIAAKSLRWRFLLPVAASVSWLRLFVIFQMSSFLNNVLPLRAGDFARGAMAARERGLNLGQVVSSMLAERAIDGVILFCCFLLTAPFIARGALVSHLTPGPRTALAVVGLAGVLLVGWLAARRYRHLVAPVWSSTLTASAEVWRRLSSIHGWPIWVTSAIGWATAFLINLTVFEALGIEVTPVMAIVVTCTTNLAMLVPASPAHIGPYHAAATVTLVVAGVHTSEAASFSVISHLVNVVPVSITGASLLALDGLRGHRAAGRAE